MWILGPVFFSENLLASFVHNKFIIIILCEKEPQNWDLNAFKNCAKNLIKNIFQRVKHKHG
jgi:hypothetical protein